MEKTLTPPEGIVGEAVEARHVKRFERAPVRTTHGDKVYDFRLYIFLCIPDRDGVYWDCETVEDLLRCEKYLRTELGLPEPRQFTTFKHPQTDAVDPQ